MADEKMRSDAETEAAVPTGQQLLRKARTTFKILSIKIISCIKVMNCISQD